ncbi:MAG: pilus assembly protein PilM [Desulfobacterales bacterium]|nr:pilus assembly protein PilM [Desulfobacterales bacterium]
MALIDIGASKTSLNILKGNSSVFMRDVALGLPPDQPEDHVAARLLLRPGGASSSSASHPTKCPPKS